MAYRTKNIFLTQEELLAKARQFEKTMTNLESEKAQKVSEGSTTHKRHACVTIVYLPYICGSAERLL